MNYIALNPAILENAALIYIAASKENVHYFNVYNSFTSSSKRPMNNK
jgi:hypothetical protein